jgi:hypothetical protein
MDIEHLSYIIVAFIAALFLNHLFSAYFKKKGKNLATKEDIAGITNKIESVKHDYASQLEHAKADLSALLTMHGYRYEKEYEVLSHLTELLVDLRDRSVTLRPVMDFKDPSKTEEEIKRERLSLFNEAGRKVYQENEKKRPFFPDEIYDAINAILKITCKESNEYNYRNPFEKGEFMAYWEGAEKIRLQSLNQLRQP